jgi:hypothetical protein
MKIHPLYPTMFFLLLGMYGFLFLIAFWLLWPYQTIEFKDIPKAGAPVINSPMYPGDPVKYELSFCKHTNNVATVHRDLVDGETIALTDITGSFPEGCRNKVIVATTNVPDTANPGRYYLEVTDEFHPNPIRTIQVRYRTSYFTVIPRPVQVEINGVPATIEVKSATTTKP